jgi:hypothetical protein
MAVKAGADGGRQMNGFEVVTVIERLVEEVFAIVQDVTKTSLWNRDCWKSGGPGRGRLGWARR